VGRLPGSTGGGVRRSSLLDCCGHSNQFFTVGIDCNGHGKVFLGAEIDCGGHGNRFYIADIDCCGHGNRLLWPPFLFKIVSNRVPLPFYLKRYRYPFI